MAREMVASDVIEAVEIVRAAVRQFRLCALRLEH
jgi:hypothetical protein